MRGAAFRRFNSVRQAQGFLGVHASVSNLFNLGRHLVRAEHYRNLGKVRSTIGQWQLLESTSWIFVDAEKVNLTVSLFRHAQVVSPYP